jgi:site-specific recombinase XerD
VRAFAGFTNEYPWSWGPGHVDEWTLSLAGERHLAPSTIRGYQTDLRLFSEYLTDGRYGWAAACAVAAKRKGALAAYRDATLFKVVYGWGLRRTETSKLDVADWGRNPAAPEFGGFGMLHVRYGKAVRGQPPRRRNVPSVMAWAVEAVAGLPSALVPHSLRHSWVTHLTEDGVDRRFIQEAVGHRCDTSTAIYTHVSGDFMNTALRKALAPALGGQQG